MNKKRERAARKYAPSAPGEHNSQTLGERRGAAGKPASRPSLPQVLGQLQREFAQPHTPIQILESVVTHAAALVAADAAVVALYGGAEPVLRVAAASDTRLAPGTSFPSVEEMNTWCLQQLRPPGRTLRARRKEPSAHCGIGLAVEFQGYALGELGVYRSRAFERQELETLEALTFLAAGAIHAAKLQAQLEELYQSAEQTRQLEIALHRIGKLNLAAISMRALATRLLTVLHNFVPFDSGALYKRESSMRFSILARNRGPHMFSSSAQAEEMNFHALPLLHEMVTVRKPIYVPDVEQAVRWRPHLPGHTAGSWLGVPLILRGVMVGLLFLGSNKTEFFTLAHRQLVQQLLLVLALVIENSNLETRRSSGRAQLSALTQQVMSAQEDERKRVSRELHDEAGQSLTALTLNLELLQQDLAGQSQALVNRARDSVTMTRQTMQRLSALSRQLRPPALDTLGLVGAIEQLCKDVQRRSGVEVSCSTHEIGDLEGAVSLTLYRYVQEALTNVVKHANATRVDVTIERDVDEVRVVVRDDGKGFDDKESLTGPRRTGRLGLLGMKERLALVDGRLEIHSVPGEGTRLVAHVPLSESQAAKSEPESAPNVSE